MLGAAYYRAGQWKDAIEALNHSETLPAGEDVEINAFVLAMTHWQLGEHDKAKEWYGTATERLAKYKSHNPDLPRFRAEAAQLLGISQP